MTYGLGCIALGCYPLALSLGYFSNDGAAPLAPDWVIGAAGLAFVIAGFMILLADHTRANDMLAGVLLLLFAAIGMWVALYSSDDGFSGGLPFVSREPTS